MKNENFVIPGATAFARFLVKVAGEKKLSIHGPEKIADVDGKTGKIAKKWFIKIDGSLLGTYCVKGNGERVYDGFIPGYTLDSYELINITEKCVGHKLGEKDRKEMKLDGSIRLNFSFPCQVCTRVCNENNCLSLLDGKVTPSRQDGHNEIPFP